MEPYKLLLKLRNNKILFSYMDTAAVVVDEEEDEWTITGDSPEGELKINITQSRTLRVAIPIFLPTKMPIQMVEEVLTKLEPEFDGLIKAELDSVFNNFVLYYYIHVGLANYTEDLDRSLIRFKQDKRSIDRVFSDIMNSLATFKNSLPDPSKTKGTKKESNLWDDIEKLDKQFEEDSFDEEDS